MGSPHLKKQLDVAGTLPAETPIPPHADLPDPSSFRTCQEFKNKIFAGKGGEVPVKGNQESVPDTEPLFENSKLVGGIGEKTRGFPWRKNLYRMRLEGHNHGRTTADFGVFPGYLDHRLMANMHSVENTDSQR